MVRTPAALLSVLFLWATPALAASISLNWDQVSFIQHTNRSTQNHYQVTFDGVLQTQFNVNGPVDTTLALGGATAFSSPSLMQASVDGVGHAQVDRSYRFTALESAVYSLSLPFAIDHTNDVSSSLASVRLFRTGLTPFEGIEHVVQFQTNGSLTGALQLSRFYESGDSGRIYAVVSTQNGSVPVPSMLWLTALGFLGLAYARYKKGAAVR